MKKKTFPVGSGVFGEGVPKICVPIVAADRRGIWKKVEEIAGLKADVVEWRADFYEDVFQEEAVLETLKGLKKRLGEKALLFTFRTKGEGGEREIDKEAYYRLNQAAAKSGCASLVDLEAFLDKSRTAEEIRKLQALGVHVIASNHDFDKTPSVDEMVRRLVWMEELGADVAKLAVMPCDAQDVLNLLQATLSADQKIHIPLVTMSMGRQGVVSRVCGGLTGSAMTFAAAGAVSAPGQIPVDVMETVLEIL